MLRQHITETEQQIARLDELLHEAGTERSVLKDWATSIMANLAAIGHSIMPDEILKNHFANHAFENFEIASYISLIALAEATGNAACAVTPADAQRRGKDGDLVARKHSRDHPQICGTLPAGAKSRPVAERALLVSKPRRAGELNLRSGFFTLESGNQAKCSELGCKFKSEFRKAHGVVASMPRSKLGNRF
jgi:hypothetical protein